MKRIILGVLAALSVGSVAKGQIMKKFFASTLALALIASPVWGQPGPAPSPPAFGNATDSCWNGITSSNTLMNYECAIAQQSLSTNPVPVSGSGSFTTLPDGFTNPTVYPVDTVSSAATVRLLATAGIERIVVQVGANASSNVYQFQGSTGTDCTSGSLSWKQIRYYSASGISEGLGSDGAGDGSAAFPNTIWEIPNPPACFREIIKTYNGGSTTFQTTAYRYPVSVPPTFAAPTDNRGGANSGLPAVNHQGLCQDGTPTTTSSTNFGPTRIDCTGHGILIEPYETYPNWWTYAAAAGGISNTTTAVTVRAAQATQRNCVRSLSLSWPTLGAATEFAIRDGAGGTVLWRGYLSMAAGSLNVPIEPPVCNAAVNTLLEVVTLSATITGGVYANVQGFSRQ